MNREKKIITFIIIFFVVFFSCFLVNKTFSSYRSNIIGSGETDIAKWELLINGDDNSINLVPGGSAVDYILKVTSKSNVSSNYSIELSNLPSDVKVSLDNSAYRVPVNGVITFSNCGDLDATSSSAYNNHTLSFMAINGASSVMDREVNIDIIAEQDNI